MFLQTILADGRYARFLAGRPVVVAGAWFPQRIDLSDELLTISSLYFAASRLDAGANFSHSRIERNFGVFQSASRGGLSLNGAEVGGGVFLRDKSRFGLVDMASARIKNNVVADQQATFGDLILNGAEVGGSVFLRDKSRFGLVDMASARISNNVDASQQAAFTKALILNGAEVGGGVFLRDKSRFGLVDMASARIKNNVVADHQATFSGPFSLYGCEVGGTVFLGEGSSLRETYLDGTHVRGSVDLAGGRFAEELNLGGATIDGTLKLSSPGYSKPEWANAARLDLRRTTVGGIDDGKDAWPGPGRLRLTGFVYKQPFGELSSAAGDFASRDVPWYHDWLKRSGGYSRQPYEQLAAVLRSVGRAETADDILIEGRDREYEQAPWYREVFGRAYRGTVGYGYHPEWAILWALLFVSIGALLARTLPFNPKAPSAIVLSAQKLIPLISFGKDYSEVDTTSTTMPPWVRRYFYLHAILGYMLAAFLLAALTRLTTT